MSKEQNILSLYKLNEREKKELKSDYSSADNSDEIIYFEQTNERITTYSYEQRSYQNEQQNYVTLRDKQPISLSPTINFKKVYIRSAIVLAVFFVVIIIFMLISTIQNSDTTLNIAEYSGVSDVSVDISSIYTYDEDTHTLTVLSEKYYMDEIQSELSFPKNDVENIIIADAVSMIGDYAFMDFEKLLSITIPDGVSRICNHAFDNCKRLTSISIPESITSIGNYAVGFCIELDNITIPDNVSYIGEGIFGFWTSDQTIYIKGKSSAPAGWDSSWNQNCDAKIVWNA